MSFAFLGFYKNTVFCVLFFFFFGLVSFSINYFEIYITYSLYISGSFWGGVAEQYSTMEIKFVHSSPDGHLGGFQFLVITNKAAMDICV